MWFFFCRPEISAQPFRQCQDAGVSLFAYGQRRPLQLAVRGPGLARGARADADALAVGFDGGLQLRNVILPEHRVLNSGRFKNRTVGHDLFPFPLSWVIRPLLSQTNAGVF